MRKLINTASINCQLYIDLFA